MAAVLSEALIDPVAFGKEVEALDAIREREVALAQWTRELPEGMAEAVSRIDLDSVDDLELILELPMPAHVLAASLVAGGYEEEAARWLAADMHMLIARHAAIVGAPRVAIRLEVVETDGCRRLHTDYVTYRLLTTYRGEATQWARADAPGRIEQMRVGEVGMFKGRKLLDQPPILHRSPPIEASGGEPRLLFVIDSVDPD